jgi:hypothetical protein
MAMPVPTNNCCKQVSQVKKKTERALPKKARSYLNETKRAE